MPDNLEEGEEKVASPAPEGKKREKKLDLREIALPRSAAAEEAAAEAIPESAPDLAGAAAEELEEALPELADEKELKRALAAVLFAAGEPVQLPALCRVFPASSESLLRKLLGELEEEHRGGPFELTQLAGGYNFLTRPEYAPFLRRLGRTALSTRLSNAALEALAVIAYRQPVTRAEIEKIRGVACGALLRALLEKGLIRIAGRSDLLGSPLLYGTSKDFLDHFGLKSLTDLPRASEFKTG